MAQASGQVDSDPEKPSVEITPIPLDPESVGRMQELHEALARRLSETSVTGEAGGGMVRIEMALDGQPRKVHVDPELYGSALREPLEDLILAALQDAARKAGTETGHIRQDHMERMGRLTSSIMKRLG